MKDRIIFGLLALGVLLIVALSEATVIKIAYIAITLLAISELWNLIKPSKSLTKWIIFVLCSIFVTGCFLCILVLRMLPHVGAIIVWLAFLGAFATDTFSYIFGMAIGQKYGKHIFPNISPKKTDIGCWGGILGATILFIIWGVVGNLIFKKWGMPFEFNMINLSICGFLCSFIAIIGDLTASWFKRKFGAKDFGSILPGHGGILDRCDSLMLAAPFVLIFNILFPVIETLI